MFVRPINICYCPECAKSGTYRVTLQMGDSRRIPIRMDNSRLFDEPSRIIFCDVCGKPKVFFAL